MASIRARKSHSYRFLRANNISLDANRMNDTNSSSISTIERSPKYRHRILSSTLKSKTKEKILISSTFNIFI